MKYPVDQPFEVSLTMAVIHTVQEFRSNGGTYSVRGYRSVERSSCRNRYEIPD